MKKELIRTTPESVGIPSGAILEFLDQAKAKGIDLHSMMLLRHGKVCAEGWWAPYAPEFKHIMFSFSKSLTSTAIGFAVQEGLMSLSDKLVDIFPDKLPEVVSDNLAKSTIRDLLMMACGHETEPHAKPGEDWIKTFLAHEFKYEPGTMFQYNTAGTNMLCAALYRKTGQHLTAFLRPRLFDKIGIEDTSMSTLPDGTEMGGAGYKIHTEDMARFITFVLNRGVWEGERLLNEAWFEEATTKRIETKNEVYKNESPDWLLGYCYQYWICRPEGVFRADGLLGQFGYVMTKQDAALILTESTTRTQEILDLAADILLPAMTEEVLDEDPITCSILRDRLSNLQMKGGEVAGLSGWGGAVAPFTGKSYQAINGATLNIEGAGNFSFGPGAELPAYRKLALTEVPCEDFYPNIRLTAETDKTSLELMIGMNGKFLVSYIDGLPYGTAGHWTSANVLEFTTYGLEGVTGAHYRLTFTEVGILAERDAIPAMGPSAATVAFKAV